jgi:hypothetical protein
MEVKVLLVHIESPLLSPEQAMAINEQCVKSVFKKSKVEFHYGTTTVAVIFFPGEGIVSTGKLVGLLRAHLPTILKRIPFEILTEADARTLAYLPPDAVE